jgi:hypothetical protein
VLFFVAGLSLLGRVRDTAVIPDSR